MAGGVNIGFVGEAGWGLDSPAELEGGVPCGAPPVAVGILSPIGPTLTPGGDELGGDVGSVI